MTVTITVKLLNVLLKQVFYCTFVKGPGGFPGPKGLQGARGSKGESGQKGETGQPGLQVSLL